jgi:hypothetical protein
MKPTAKLSLPFCLQLAKENNFSLVQKAKNETPVDINPNTVSQILRKALSYFSAIQAHDGHWPGDFPGPLFTTATMVKISIHSTVIFLEIIIKFETPS